MTPLIRGRQFEADFEANALHLSEADPAAALRFVDAVEAVIQLLAGHPEMGPVWRYGNPRHPTRYLLVPGFHNYLIFIVSKAENCDWGVCCTVRKTSETCWASEPGAIQLPLGLKTYHSVGFFVGS